MKDVAKKKQKKLKNTNLYLSAIKHFLFSVNFCSLNKDLYFFTKKEKAIRKNKIKIHNFNLFNCSHWEHSYGYTFFGVKQSYQKHNFPVHGSSISNESLRRTVDNENK